MHRVVITGAGAVSSLGADLSSNFKSLSEGKSGISKIEFLNSDRLSIKIGGQIKNYNPDIHFTNYINQNIWQFLKGWEVIVYLHLSH